MLFFNWFWGRKGMEGSCRQGSLGLVEPWCKGSVELAYTCVIVATCFRLVFVLFSSCFRLFAVFLPYLYRDGLNMVSGRIEREGRWESVGRGFGRVG